MRIAIIAKEESASAIARLLNELSTIELLDSSELEERLNQGQLDWQPAAIFFELLPMEQLSSLVKQTQRLRPAMPCFSFVAAKTVESEHQSAALGFIAHLDNQTTLAEIKLHLSYGRRLRVTANEGEARLSLTEALAAVAAFHYTLDLEKVTESAIEQFSRLFQADSVALFLSSEDGEQLEIAGQRDALLSPPIQMANASENGNLLARAASSDRPTMVVEAQLLAGEPRYKGKEHHNLLFLPLHTRARLFGVVELILPKQYGLLSDSELALAEQMATALAAALANAITFGNAERLGQIDDLTQLYNSRYLYQALDAEMKRSRRYKTPVSVIFLDLDGFKLVNDTNGHLCGSATLTEVANLMIGLVRETDIVARYGGDEFVIVLPETPAERAVTIAERIRHQIENHVFRGGGENKIVLTASFGVASYPENASSPAALIRCADKAMYVAKECNKNQVVLAN